MKFTVSIPDGLNETTTFETFKTNIAGLSQVGGVSIISTESINLLNGNVDGNSTVPNETVITDNSSNVNNKTVGTK